MEAGIVSAPLHEGLHPVIVRSPPLTVKEKPSLGDVGSAADALADHSGAVISAASTVNTEKRLPARRVRPSRVLAVRVARGPNEAVAPRGPAPTSVASVPMPAISCLPSTANIIPVGVTSGEKYQTGRPWVYDLEGSLGTVPTRTSYGVVASLGLAPGGDRMTLGLGRSPGAVAMPW